jgi:hypothetical protein
MSEPMTVLMSLGVLTFDGQVGESFGYSFDRPVRVEAKGQPISPNAHFTEEEAANPEVTKLIDAVRAAAPNLERAA